MWVVVVVMVEFSDSDSDRVKLQKAIGQSNIFICETTCTNGAYLFRISAPLV